MECREIEWLIDAYLDRTLSRRVAGELGAHLESCSVCRKTYGPMLRLLSSPEPIAVPDGLRDRIAAAVSESTLAPAARREHPKAAVGAGRGIRRIAMPWAGAIAASVAFFAMGWLGSRWWVNRPTELHPFDRGREHPPARVVLSPWAMSNLAQAMASHASASPIALVAQAATSEWLVESLFRPPPALPARATTAPAASGVEADVEPAVPILPPVIRL